MNQEQAVQARFEGWAVVEMMGHQREVGFVTTEYFGGACLFRVDVPDFPEREYILRRPEYAKTEKGTVWCPAGCKVQRPAMPAKSRLVGVPSIYAITPCTEETALRAIEELIKPELILLEMPEGKTRLLEQAADPEVDDMDDDDDGDEDGDGI